MDETYLVNQIKEQCCFISEHFKKDIETVRWVRTCFFFHPSRKIYPDAILFECYDIPYRREPRTNSLRVHYVLPDYSMGWQGYIKASPHYRVGFISR